MLRRLGLRRDESLELVERVTPPIVVKRAALLSLEPTLGEVDLGRFAEIAERKAYPGLDVVGTRLLQTNVMRDG